MSADDCSLLLQHLIKLDPPKLIEIGEFSFEYIGQPGVDARTAFEFHYSSIETPTITSLIFKIGGGIFAYNFDSSDDKIKNFVMSNDFKIGKDICRFKIISIDRIPQIEEVIGKKKPSNRTIMFKVKLDEQSLKNTPCEPDGFVYISTSKPSAIYDTFGVDSVLSVEKIGGGYFIK